MNLESFNFKPLYTLDKEWALLTCGTKEKFNTMTVSWGEMGTLWGKPVATVYVRPSRYTYEFMENEEYFTLSFFDEIYKKDLGILGAKSGRDIDKISLTKLTPIEVENSMSFKQAKLILICKKIYSQDLDIEKFQTDIKEKFYQNEPVHRMYIGEIVDIINK